MRTSQLTFFFFSNFWLKCISVFYPSSIYFYSVEFRTPVVLIPFYIQLPKITATSFRSTNPYVILQTSVSLYKCLHWRCFGCVISCSLHNTFFFNVHHWLVFLKWSINTMILWCYHTLNISNRNILTSVQVNKIDPSDSWAINQTNYSPEQVRWGLEKWICPKLEKSASLFFRHRIFQIEKWGREENFYTLWLF